MMLSMVAQKADPLNTARKALNNCMVEVHNKGVTDKTSPSDFLKTAEVACPTERTAYHGMLVRAERGYGSSQKDAEKYADEEIQMMIDGVVTAFNENVDSGAKLSLEK